MEKSFTPPESSSDPALAELYAEPVSIKEPHGPRAPFVFASPHSGRVYPRALLQMSRLSSVSLRRSEDAYVDDLFSGAVSLGAPLIAARFPRAYVDANRAPGELDPAMFEDRLDVALDRSSPRVSAGLGVIPRIVRDGAEIYRTKLKAADALDRLARLHQPYHAALSAAMHKTSAQFGAAVVIDCHSMPSAATAPDIVLGDRYGTSASYTLLHRAEQALLSCGFAVGRNVPYAGGYTTLVFGQPAKGIHALQIEVNRALYLDEERIVVTARFAGVQARLTAALRELMAIDISLLRPQRGLSLAAE